jgi:hypothetical protein
MPERSSAPNEVWRDPHSGGIKAGFELELKTNLDAGFHRHDELSRRLKVVMSRWSEDFDHLQ